MSHPLLSYCRSANRQPPQASRTWCLPGFYLAQAELCLERLRVSTETATRWKLEEVSVSWHMFWYYHRLHGREWHPRARWSLSEDKEKYAWCVYQDMWPTELVTRAPSGEWQQTCEGATENFSFHTTYLNYYLKLFNSTCIYCLTFEMLSLKETESDYTQFWFLYCPICINHHPVP